MALPLKLFAGVLFFWMSFQGTIHAQQFSFKSYGIREGLPQSQVHCLLQDKRGYLWIGTIGGGLSRFDGQRFKTYTTSDGLPGNKVLSLEYCQNKLWIGLEKGLRAFDGSSFHQLIADSLQIEFLEKASDHELWIGSDKGLYLLSCLDESSNKLQKISNGGAIFAMCKSKSGIWVANYKYITHFNTEGKKDAGPFEINDGIVNSLFEDSKGQLWVGIYGRGLRVLENGLLQLVAGFENITPQCFYEPDGSSLWVGTLENGIYMFFHESGGMVVLNDRNGLPNNQVRCILKDKWENVWAGTYGGGLARYYGSEVKHLNKDSGLPGRQVYSVAQGFDSLIWMGVADKGIVRYDPNKATLLVDSLLTNVKVKALYNDGKGRIWAGTEGKGLQIYQRDTSWNIHAEQGLISPWIKCIRKDHNGRIWLALSGGGIARINNAIDLKPDIRADISYFNQLNAGIANDRVNTLAFDQSLRMWYGCQSGGFGYITLDEKVINYGSPQGLKNLEIKALLVDKREWLWIGTAEGLCRMNLNIEPFVLEYISDNYQPKGGNIYLLQEDIQGNVWAGDQSGVYKFELDEENRILNTKHYGQRDGFEGIETCMNASSTDSNGRLWFGTIDGVNCISLVESGKEGKIAPNAFVSGISLFYQPLSETSLRGFINTWGALKDTLVLTYEQNHLSFDFAGIHLGDAEGVLFQWKLSGLDTSWTPPLPLNNATFSNLKPGEYSLLMRACLEDGECSPVSSVPFIILQPYWQKGWFIAVSILGGLILVAVVFVLILRGVQRRAREKNAKLLLEKQLVELEQKSLRLQMNPHFVFNSLNSIQGLIAADDPKGARQQLSRFSRLMRQILENSREEKVTIKEEIEALTNYLDLEKSTRADIFDYQIDCQVNPEHYELPPLLIQPFAENAIIHGLAPKGKGGFLRITFKENNGVLLIAIEDNGIGRKASAEKKQSSGLSHKSAGLEVTEERLALLRGNADTPITFEDLYDDEGKANGTRVIIKIPLNLLTI
jgi:ligand-binding sensor domain-containing protein/two-component sensor histidine kinase